MKWDDVIKIALTVLRVLAVRLLY